MIDHASLAVSDLGTARAFYAAALGPLGHRLIAERAGRAGFGKTYPELWLNERPGMAPTPEDVGAHLCFRAPDVEAVKAFHAAALAAGGADDGAPGLRRATMVDYFAAFVRDPDGNRLEAMTVPRRGAP